MGQNAIITTEEDIHREGEYSTQNSLFIPNNPNND